MTTTPRSAPAGPYPNRVAERRLELEISQATVAADVGLVRPALSRIETGQALATPSQLERLCAALSCTARDLYSPDLLAVIQNAGRTR